MTATIRVGRCLGALQCERAKLVARTALTLSVIFALFIATLTVLCRKGIVAIYTEDAAVAALAAQLLLYQAAYQIVDGLQVTGIGVLRGHNDTRIISAICFVAYWIIGLPLGFALARTNLLTPAMMRRSKNGGCERFRPY
jgi:Na+-driven multidrug efflux pump